MLKILLIDDDRLEAVFWQQMEKRHFKDEIAFEWEGTVEAAIPKAQQFEPDIVFLDNYIPPHTDAYFALTELQRIEFGGKIFVWSELDGAAMETVLEDFPAVEHLPKGDYAGPHLKGLIQQLLREH